MPAPALVVLAYGLMALGWVASSPATAAPDEGAHYIRALSVANGELRGSSPPPLATPATVTAQQRDALVNTRLFTLPNRLMPPASLICTAFHPERSAACQAGWGTQPSGGSARQPTYVGSYQPYLYLFPGLFARAGRSFRSGILLARLATTLLTVGLVGLAVAVLWDRESGGFSLVGLLVALTPMAVFLFAAVNTSGPEIAGAVCLASALLALGRRVDPPGWWWLAAGCGGAVLATGRGTGIGFVVLILAVGVGWSGWGPMVERARRGGWVALAAGAVVGTAMAAGLGWELAFHPHQPAAAHSALRHTVPSLLALGSQFHQQVGLFGWLDTQLPGVEYLGWAVLLTVLVALAALVGSRRQRWTLAGAFAAYLVSELAIGAVVMPPTGYPIQGRYTLPVALVIPLVAGEMLRANLPRLGPARPRSLPLLFAGSVAVLQVVAWWANARRYAVGDHGRIFFLNVSQWHPVGGWGPWVALAVGGSSLLVLALRLDQPSGPGADVEA